MVDGTRRFRSGAIAAVIVAVVVLLAGTAWLWSSMSTDGPEPGAVDGSAVEQVHLGDSFAAGTGTSPLVEDSPFTCQRSSVNFGQLIAKRHGYRLTDVSCAGAWTKSLYEAQYQGVAPQLDALGPGTDLVTMMIGGNDATLYSTLVGACGRAAGSDPSGAPCRAELGDRPEQAISTEIRPAVERALRDIRNRAPHARIVIAGYPWLTPASESCRPTVQIADGDVSYVRRNQARLNSAISLSAKAVGATFADMSWAANGHDACQPRGTSWILPMVGSPSGVTMHPNEAGQRALADAVDAVLPAS
ncbi:SGNH/GDSL hydrolase family protein [Gordonia zhaorongruii]|uniref:SGNH/GDSL hydrolase family protein n=1 Tax=Gordonia zhaorongruii TaxID=2597659 RepID=UPI001F2DB537|nr:SGNH/GDSL hydrolase family protein [Gordonia zhaorongruii]